jgi:uncharacterized alkaline shock family protein YloU
MTSPPGASVRQDAGRGTLTVAPRAVEKIAAAAAADVAAVGGPPPRVARRRRGSAPAGRPRVSAKVGAGTVRLSMSMSVAYPAPLRETAHQVRARVQEQVAALAGLRVVHLDIDVAALRTRERAPRVE